MDAGTALRLDIPGLVQHADLVFEGRVRSAQAVIGASGLIETEYEIDVVRTFEGTPEATRSVRLPGGVLPNGNGLILPGMPELRVGEDLILFLSEPSASGVRVPVGLSQGKFRVETNLAGEKQVSRRHGSLTVVDPGSAIVQDANGSELFGYAEVVARVHAAVAQEQMGSSSPAVADDE